MTSYIKKLPVAMGMLFFAVGCSSAIFGGTDISTALFRGVIAAVPAALLSALIGYILFYEKLPEAEVPEELVRLTKDRSQSD
jgi:hypothetical protein